MNNIVPPKKKKRFERWAFALAIYDENSQKFLFGKRGNCRREYVGTWSLPSTSISADQYQSVIQGKPSKSALALIHEISFSGKRPSWKIIGSISGDRVRHHYDFHMMVLLVRSIPNVELSAKYSEFRWATIGDALELAHGRVGTCVSLLAQYMIDNGNLDPAVSYLELSPDLWRDRDNLSKYSDESLWERAAGDYRLMKMGDTGSDGARVRSIILNKYWDEFICSLETGTALLDVGSGSGELIQTARNRGLNAIGVDLGAAANSTDVLVGNALNLSRQWGPETFDTITLNLVVQWICDLERLVKSIRQVIRSSGLVCISFTPIEYARPGHFVSPKASGESWGWCSDYGISRNPRLTMVNRTVGPVRFYPRTANAYIRSFGAFRLRCVDARYLFLDSYLQDGALGEILNANPLLARHLSVPAFQTLTFRAE